MVGKNIYYDDYVAGYIGIKDIPYKYWDQNVIKYALFKEPLTYYIHLLINSYSGLTGMSVEECLAKIPNKYKTLLLYKQLLNFNSHKYRYLIPNDIYNKIRVRSMNSADLVANFKYIPETERTPFMYQVLSKVSFEDYLMYAVNYHDLPDIYRKKVMCLGMFYGDIDKYVREIPDEYKTIELGEFLANIDFNRWFPILPEHCKSSSMYEKFVEIDPVKNIDLVPKDKRTGKMYEMLFDYTLDTYLNKIPKEYITKEMWHRLIRINPSKYLHIAPSKYVDKDIAIYLLESNPRSLSIIPKKLLTKSFFIGLIKKNPKKYLSILPEKYYTDDVAMEIAKILENHYDKLLINANPKLNRMILKYNSTLINQFTPKAFHDIINEELIKMVDDGTDIIDIVNKYHVNTEAIMRVFKSLAKKDHNLYKSIKDYLNGDRVYQKYINIDADLRKLEEIILSIGNVSRHSFSINQKLQFAYLTKKYLTYSLEDIYAYNNSERNSEVSKTVNAFIEYVLDYTIYFDVIIGSTDLKLISTNNEWLINFNYIKYFNITDGVARSKYFYGIKNEELTTNIASTIINRLKMEEIPLNYLIVIVAFRKYFLGELDNYINELHSYDMVLKKTKRKKR